MHTSRHADAPSIVSAARGLFSASACCIPCCVPGLAWFPRCGAALGAQLPQLGVLGFGLLQDGNVRVGVFPDGEEILVGAEAELVARGMIPPVGLPARVFRTHAGKNLPETRILAQAFRTGPVPSHICQLGVADRVRLASISYRLVRLANSSTR